MAHMVIDTELLLNRLDSLFDGRQLRDLAFLVRSAEDEAQSFFRDTVSRLLQENVAGITLDSRWNRLMCGESQVNLELVRDFRLRGCRGLVLKVERLDGIARTLKKSSVYHIQEPGEIRQLQIISDPDLVQLFDSIGEMFLTIYANSYRCIAARIADIATFSAHRATCRLYNQIRSRLPSDLASNVWLFACDGKVGFYLLDPLAAENAISKLSLKAATGIQSPLLAFTRFATHIPDIDNDKFLSAEVIKSATSVNAGFLDVDYDADVKLAQLTLYGSKNFKVQWLVRDGRFGLTACYPSEQQSIVEPILTSQRERLRAIIASEHKYLFRLKHTLEKYKADVAKGEFVGGVIGGLLKSMAEP